MITITPTELTRILNWIDRLSVWDDETLNEFLKDVYGFEAAPSYLDEKREKLKRSVFEWFCSLDLTNRARLTSLLNTKSPDHWWQNYKANDDAE